MSASARRDGGKLDQVLIDRANDDVVAVVGRYLELTKKGSEYVALCPFHKEKTPSFTVVPDKGMYYCHGCGAGGDAVDFVEQFEGVGFREAVQRITGNLPLGEAAHEHRQSLKRQDAPGWVPVMPVPADATAPDFKFRGEMPTRTWLYHDANGSRLGYVCRFDRGEGKEVLPLSWCVSTTTGEMCWRWMSFSKPRPLFGLDKLAANPNSQVLVVEGEKVCDAAQALYEAAGIPLSRLVVVSWPGGAKAAKYVDWSPLEGRSVALWPDADQQNYPERHAKAGQLMPFIEQVGTACMIEIATLIEGSAMSVKLIEPPAGVPDGFDLADDLPVGVDLLAHTKASALSLAEFRLKHGIASAAGERKGPADVVDLDSARKQGSSAAASDQLAATAPVLIEAVLAAQGPAAEFEEVAETQQSRPHSIAQRLIVQEDQVPLAQDVVPGMAPKRRTVQVVPGELPAAVDQAEAALYEQCPDIFQRAGAIVRPVRALVDVAGGDKANSVRLSAVSKHHLAERLTAAAGWEKYDGRAGDFVPIDCPMVIAETYLARDGSWRLRSLAGIIDAPTLRQDGSILSGEGYDAATGLLVMGDQSKFPEIPAEPSQEDARTALDRLKELIDDFPFVSNIDKSVSLSAILTACIRRSLPTAPMHCFSAPTAGSGKSTLVDVASIIANGHRAAVMSQGRDEAEQEKRLVAALLAGDAVVSIDNATQPLDGDLLCQALTQDTVRVRVLGASELRSMPTNAFFAATGNSLLLQGDMTRRALLCSLDPQCERPELRTFTNNPLQIAAEGRARYLCAALTILRAFHVAGRPKQVGVSQLGSFEVWSGWVRSALVWLGEADPVATMEKARKSDPKLEAFMSLMAQWESVIGDRSVTVREVISIATEQENSYGQARAAFLHEDFREALLINAGQAGVINSRSLGKLLAANKERVVGLPSDASGERPYRRFVQGAPKHNVATWSLQNPNPNRKTDELPI